MPNTETSSTGDLEDKDSEEGEFDSRKIFSLSLSQLRKHTDFANFYMKPAPYNIRWINGYNPRAGVINLNDRGSTAVFYGASNCGVIYNWSTNTMKILQGHRHMVTCIASDAAAKWLVTADSGPENIIIIWDSADCYPQKTIFLPHRNVKLARLALSADAKYLLTLGYSEKASLFWWIWSYGRDEPHAVIEVDIARDGVVEMEFNPHNSDQFLLMTKHDIWIGTSGKIFVMERGVLKETEDYQLKIRKPEKKVHQEIGNLSSFTFVKDTSQVLVATTRGTVLIYGYTMEYTKEADTTNFENLKYVKVLKIEKYRINVIKSIDGVIVTGNNAGEIHFYDDQIKLLYWVHGFSVNSVMSISFNVSPRAYQIFDPKCNKKCACWEKVEVTIDENTGQMRQKLVLSRLPTDATTHGKTFLVRDFIVSTKNDGIGFVDFVTEKYKTILDYKPSPVLSLTVHPDNSIACMGFTNGIVELINFVSHKLIVRLDLRDHYKIITPPKEDSIKGDYDIYIPELSVTAVKYSPSGMHLACGLNTGQLLFLDPSTIEIITRTPFKDTIYAVKDITYSCDSLTLAFSDIGHTICVYKYDCVSFTWSFIGKHRAHYKDITAVFFLPRKNENGEYKLISLGLDRIMVEYDIGASSEEYLEVLSLDRMDQTAVPLGAIVWPAPVGIDPEKCHVDMPLILVATDEFKYKIVNYDTTMTLATFLGPRYEHPASRMQLTSKTVDGVIQEYLLYATKNVIGMQKMPLDGNPWKHVGMLGHPNAITTMCYRQDNETLFIIGAKDTCMCQWAANHSAVESTTKMGGEDLDPYYCLVENGRPGWLFQEIRDLFYYIQILCQGTFSPAMRRVKDYIPIESLPDMMRALGFFPSEYEVENLIVEAKFKVYQKVPSSEIDFEEFVKFYLNHRPAFGENIRKIRNAFYNFATFHKEEHYMERSDFIEMLSEYGEQFSPELSWYLLSILSGQSFEDRAAMCEEDFSFLPEKILLNDLLANVMGVQDVETMSSQHESAMDSTLSQQTSSLESDERPF